jgi:hypothetical protein
MSSLEDDPLACLKPEERARLQACVDKDVEDMARAPPQAPFSRAYIRGRPAVIRKVGDICTCVLPTRGLFSMLQHLPPSLSLAHSA